MSRRTPSFGPLADTYQPIRGLSKTRAIKVVRNDIRNVFEQAVGFRKPKRITPHLPGHREVAPKLCLGANSRENCGKYFQVCMTCNARYFHWLDREPDPAVLRRAQHLLDILQEIETYTPPAPSRSNTQTSSSLPATPQQSTSRQVESPRVSPTVHTKKRCREAESNSDDNSSSSGQYSSPTVHRPRKYGWYAREDTPPPYTPLTAEELETGEAFDLTRSIKVDIHLDGRVFYEVMYPRKDGWFRLSDYKAMLGEQGFEQMRPIQGYNFYRSKWEYCLWETPYPVEKGELFLFRYAI
ncbi:hypothetical protein CPC08DRAFT_763246 [Agrocybe pediades]|nr:hypothetical protein CPC08DRAFT_763246 [Agrocybe pediades]